MTPVTLAVLTALLLAAPVAAQTTSNRRAAAEDALQRVQRLADGRGVRTGRELSAALAELAAQRSALSTDDRRQADALLGRPTDKTDFTQPGGPYSNTAAIYKTCSARFCVHWVDRTEDAPSPANADSCPATPDYVDFMRRSFEQSAEVENDDLGWTAPIADGALGGDARTDVYVKELNADTSGGSLFGYAATDAGQSADRRHAFLVLDDDYAADEFDGYGGDPTIPVQVTAAHEYNHVLQYAYDFFQDSWMFESTATWAEDKVFPAGNDFHAYMPEWALHPEQPITSDAGSKMYGSAIWNHWLARRYGDDAVREAWARSIDAGDFAPGAYDLVNGSNSFGREFAEFAASTAEWRTADAGIHDGPLFSGDVHRNATLQFGVPKSLTLDHAAYAVYTVPPLDPAPTGTDTPLQLTGSLPPGTDGSIALVAREGGDVTVVLQDFGDDGKATVSLPQDPRGIDRVSAVIVNEDTSFSGYDALAGDWRWTRDDQVGSLTIARGNTNPGTPLALPAEGAPTGAEPLADCGTTTLERAAPVTPTPTATPTPTPTPTATVTPTPTVTPPPPRPPTSVRLQRGSARLRTVARKGLLPLFATVNKAGAATATATVDRKTAKRLKLGRSRTLGTGRKTMSRAGIYKVNLKLSRKVRRALRRSTRSVKLTIRLQFVPADGRAAVARRLTVTLKR